MEAVISGRITDLLEDCINNPNSNLNFFKPLCQDLTFNRLKCYMTPQPKTVHLQMVKLWVKWFGIPVAQLLDMECEKFYPEQLEDGVVTH